MHALTKHQPGGIRELWALSWPMMASIFSVTLMLFIDRLLLAYLSTDALNASTNAMTASWVWVCAAMCLAGISEVFVSQYYGRKENHRIGEPVWQMLWFCAISFAFFVPLAIWSGELLYYGTPLSEMQRDYYQIMITFAPVAGAYAALCAFWIGRGKPVLITYLAIVANIVNAVLDMILIFGIDGWIPKMGVKGAAIATSTGFLFQALVLFILFLNKKNRAEFGTGNWKFRFEPFLQCIRFGLPMALCVGLEIAGWAMFYELMTSISNTHITVASVCQSFCLLFFFFGDGIERGAMALSGNYIGAKQPEMLLKVLRSGFVLLMLFCIALISTYIIGHEFFLTQFIDVKEVDSEALFTFKICLLLTLGYLFFEGARKLIIGLLTGAGDTLFLMLAGFITIWSCLLVPVYFFVVRIGAAVEWALVFWVIYALIAVAILAWRFQTGKWRSIKVIESEREKQYA